MFFNENAKLRQVIAKSDKVECFRDILLYTLPCDIYDVDVPIS